MSDSILVIGGGIAGINCAMNAAKYGTKVYLIDDTPSIGGMMARLDKTFPTNDCSICIEAPQMYEVDNHENIEILTNTEVRKVKKVNGTFKVKLMQKAKYVDEEKCTGCGACVEVCPVSVPDPLDGKVGGMRKLVSMAFPQAVPNVVTVDPTCRFGDMRKGGACIGDCAVDCKINLSAGCNIEHIDIHIHIQVRRIHVRRRLFRVINLLRLLLFQVGIDFTLRHMYICQLGPFLVVNLGVSGGYQVLHDEKQAGGYGKSE